MDVFAGDQDVEQEPPEHEEPQLLPLPPSSSFEVTEKPM